MNLFSNLRSPWPGIRNADIAVCFSTLCSGADVAVHKRGKYPRNASAERYGTDVYLRSAYSYMQPGLLVY